MKTFIIFIAFTAIIALNSNAQDNQVPERFGHTLNISAGVGYNGYVGHALPFGTLNYEFDIARNFTLAPFVGIYSYQNYYYPEDPVNTYYYRETVVPVGVKGAYYFDELFHAGSRWDFYAAGSIGFAIKSVEWSNNYYGDRYINKSASPLYLNAHIGSEYHLNPKAGLFLDLSTGVSTFGLAVHFNH